LKHSSPGFRNEKSGFLDSFLFSRERNDEDEPRTEPRTDDDDDEEDPGWRETYEAESFIIAACRGVRVVGGTTFAYLIDGGA